MVYFELVEDFLAVGEALYFELSSVDSAAARL
jgi:hypothetical protein